MKHAGLKSQQDHETTSDLLFFSSLCGLKQFLSGFVHAGGSQD